METRSKRLRRLSEVSHIDKLGDGILEDILIRGLPNPRSACHCKTVCKRWRDLISSPSFNLRFVSHHQTMDEVIIHTHDPDSIFSFMPPPDIDVLVSFKVLDCFKDLLLCGFMARVYNDPEISRTFVVCNPFTKQWLTLPVAPKKAKGHAGSEARLVCEPVISNKQASVYSEYRFRVVILYEHDKSIKLDVFCSESGEWTREALVLDCVRLLDKNVVSLNGEMFWVYARDDDGKEDDKPLLAAFNPFRLDIPPTCIDLSTLSEKPTWNISVSQGALHIAAFEMDPAPDPAPGCSGVVSSIWRLDQDRKSWSKRIEGPMKNTSSCIYDPMECSFHSLHPENMEVAFFRRRKPKSAFLSCDLRRGELEFVAKAELPLPRFIVVQPKFSCCPTPIPRYEELRGKYSGSHSCLVQSTKAPTSSATGDESQAVEGLEQSVYERNNRSASHPRHRVKKRKCLVQRLARVLSQMM